MNDLVIINQETTCTHDPLKYEYVYIYIYIYIYKRGVRGVMVSTDSMNFPDSLCTSVPMIYRSRQVFQTCLYSGELIYNKTNKVGDRSRG